MLAIAGACAILNLKNNDPLFLVKTKLASTPNPSFVLLLEMF